jgi:hypothetical protein
MIYSAAHRSIVQQSYFLAKDKRVFEYFGLSTLTILCEFEPINQLITLTLFLNNCKTSSCTKKTRSFLRSFIHSSLSHTNTQTRHRKQSMTIKTTKEQTQVIVPSNNIIPATPTQTFNGYRL